MSRATRLLALLAAVLLLGSLPARAVDTKTRRASVKSNGNEAPEGSDGYIDGLSDDGKLAAFATDGAFVAADDNGVGDVYLRNMGTGKTRWVSVNGDAVSDGPTVSGNGKFVAFTSEANNLAPHDGDGDNDAFIYNVETKSIQLVSRNAVDVGTQPAVNFSGRFVAFETASQVLDKDNNHVDDIYLRDRKLNKTRLISVDSQGNDTVDGDSDSPSLSSGGRFVAFESEADDLVGNDDNNARDIFLRDWLNGKTRRLSVKTSGAEKSGDSHSPSINADGSLVSFDSASRLAGADDNGTISDVYLRNVGARRTMLITRDRNGDPTDGNSSYSALSPNGRLIGFYSYATDLIATDPAGVYSAYVFDRKRGKVFMVDRKSSGTPGDMASYVSGIANRFVHFSTNSALVNTDTNGTYDVYRRGPFY